MLVVQTVEFLAIVIDMSFDFFVGCHKRTLKVGLYSLSIFKPVGTHMLIRLVLRMRNRATNATVLRFNPATVLRMRKRIFVRCAVTCTSNKKWRLRALSW